MSVVEEGKYKENQYISEKSGGFFQGIADRLKPRRLGDVLVSSRLISKEQLAAALTIQQRTRQPLGQILIDIRALNAHALRRKLMEQWCLRGLAALMTLFVNFGTLSSARADQPELTLVSAITVTPDLEPLNGYPALFGMKERKSHDIKPFTKWTDMLKRFEVDLKNTSHNNRLELWKANLIALQDAALEDKINGVNEYINQVRYITDNKNWGDTDYWATPIEFFSNGGDCEDFAIAKYASLKALGVPEDRMRIAIVQDRIKNIPHAVLIVYTDNGALILDNQAETVKPARDVTRYKPIFSINQQGWWLHYS